MKDIQVYKNNALLNAKSRWSTQEQKLFNVLLSDLNEEKGQTFKITKSTLENLFQVELRTEYLQGLTSTMVKKGFRIQRGKGSWSEIQIFSSIDYEEGLLTLNMTNEALPHLHVLKDYTKFMLKDILILKSKYSIRIYELLKREAFKRKKSFRISVEDLREFVGVKPGEYNRFSDFEKFTLMKAKEEINESTELKFDYDKIKKWRTIEEIEFIYEKIDGNVKIPGYMDFKEFSQSKKKKIMTIGVNKTIEINSRNNWRITPEEYIMAQAKKTKESKPDNAYGFFIKALEEDWAEFEDSRKLKLNQISFDDIKIEEKKESKRKVPQKRKSNKDFEEREYDYDDLENKLLGWENL